jgi:omega-amidase
METKNELIVSIIQTDIYWENPIANRAEIEELIASNDIKPDLIVLPEMFTTGFSSKVLQLAEPMNFTTHKWMKQMATQYKTAICGSLIISENGKYYNRLLFVKPSGITHYYDKKHLFAYGGESELFSAGTEKLIFEMDGWNICPLICYDLRFPVFCRNKFLEYDLLLYSASWPESRIQVWDTLLMARAIENQSYVVGVNRIGTDGNQIKYCGHSAGINAKGILMNERQSNQGIVTLHLSKKELDTFRKKFPAHLDADEFRIK